MLKTTLSIPEDLLKEAMRRAGVRTKTQTIRLALEALIRQQRLERVIAKAGSLHFEEDGEKGRHGR